jgi:hypothetical protein
MFRTPGPAAARLQVPEQPDPASEIEVVRWMEQMRTDLAESLGGIMLRAVRPVPLTVLPTILSASPGRLVGWSLRETGGTNGFACRFYNGDNSAADVVAIEGGPASAVRTQLFPAGGISFTEGLYLSLVTGGSLSSSVEGVVYLGASD